MKKLCTLVLYLVISHATFSQIFEYQFTGLYGRIYKVADNEYVYGILNDSIRQFDVYSLDHQLIKTIAMPAYDLYFGFLHLSKTLFNSDEKFELLYSYQNMNPSGFGVRVVNEDGLVLFEALGFWGVYLYNTPVGAKMMLNYPSGPSKVNVYSLDGIVLESEELGYLSDSQIFPNPTDGHVNITFDAPYKESDLVLSIYSIKGILVDQWNLDSRMGHIQIDVSRLPTGTYFYRIHNNSFSTLAKKLIVKK